jgi:tRNA (guanine37-N1)-methyltransferase
MKLKQIFKNKLTKKQLGLVPNSFDVIGGIAIFSQFPEELNKKQKLIGETLIKINKNIKTVAKKIEKHRGRLRLKKIKIIAGKKTKETLYKENNVVLKLDVEKCYFSPRLGSERLRIAKLVKPNESVLVMFSGVAPYPLVISKNSRTKEVYAIELSRTAHKYAQENLKLNKINNIKLFQGDVKRIIPKIKRKFDRIVMPLPKSAETYLDLALKVAKKNTVIHLYQFGSINDFNKIKKEIKERYKIKILKLIRCGQYSPRKYRICLDLKVL